MIHRLRRANSIEKASRRAAAALSGDCEPPFAATALAHTWTAAIVGHTSDDRRRRQLKTQFAVDRE